MRKKHDIEELLAAGDKLFRKQGFHQTGTDQLLSLVDYPRSSFYYHFKSKEGFSLKTVEFYGNIVRENLIRCLGNPDVKSPTQRLRDYYLMIARYGKECNYESCCLLHRVAMESAVSDQELKKTAYAEFRSWVKLTIPVIEEAQSMGEFRSDLTVKEISEFLFSSIYGSHTIARISGKANEMKDKMNFSFKLLKA